MNGQITPDQVQNLLLLSIFILLFVILRLIGLAAWHKSFENTTTYDHLTQEERDDCLMQRRQRRRHR